MNVKKNSGKTKKSRRNFLKSTGLFIAGLSIFRPTYLFGRNNINLTESPSTEAIPKIILQDETILPEGVKPVWDISKAYRETTITRESICINGLWQWQPGIMDSEALPPENWGYFKVPGEWPGGTNYMQKASQSIFSHPAWKDQSPGNINVAWYQREIDIPENWSNRKVFLSIKYLNSSASVFINGNMAGEILFPAGELDLSAFCKPGNKYTLSLKVAALPLQDVVAIFSDSNASRQGKGAVDRRGLCGDVFLCSRPKEVTISKIQIITSVRTGNIKFNVTLENLPPKKLYVLRSVITKEEKLICDFTSGIFNADQLKNGIYSFTESWLPDNLWDIHTPENMFECTVSLLEKNNNLLDTAFPVRFGFREFWIGGRDFYLNGSRIFLSAVPFDNALVGAAWANYEAAKESMKRLMNFGINFVYTHNYGCEPGTHLSYDEILNAADDVGMLISFSQPHFGQYDWKNADADQKNGYAHHAEFYTKVAGNHPSVIFYSMSHNACGYNDDMNPDMIDGIHRTDSAWSSNNVKKALRAEAIVAGMDAERIIYHHSSGNLGSMHTSNFYPNWVPNQELSDWFEHWANEGVKPLFLCEFSAPFTWDWGLYRGWYKGKREFGSASVPWEFCLAEWNAQFLGDEAYKISEFEKTNLRWEAKRFQEGATWHRWDYPYSFDSSLFNERIPVLKTHLTDQWRAFRTLGMSANSPWDYASYWQLKNGLSENKRNLNVDWENLQKPGFSADFIERENRMDLDVAFNQSDWLPTASKALIQNNMPLLAYIGGKSSAFTSKDHNFLPGTKLEKQLIIINNSRVTVQCECSWSLNLPDEVKSNKTIQLVTGHQEHIPLLFDLPSSLKPGNYLLQAEVKFENNKTLKDSFEINILPAVHPFKLTEKIALFDPIGETKQLFDRLGIQYQIVEEGADLNNYNLIIIGKKALNTEGKGLNVDGVRNGLKVIVFEQTSEVLEKRFGFRVQEYGLRKVFRRISDHPLLAALEPENLHDWHGSSTIYPERRNLILDENIFNGAPTIKWCDIPVTRVWRCGNRGNVASVLIEKPACGNFLPVVDGGYSLQYSPLIEYREGNGMVLFCQLDVTGRTEEEPAGIHLVKNMLSYAFEWKPKVSSNAFYIGDSAGFNHLKNAGVSLSLYDRSQLSADQILIVTPDDKKTLLFDSKFISNWLKKGGRVVAIGLNQEEINAVLPKVTMKDTEHITAFFETFESDSPFAGIGSSDVHNREPKKLPLVAEGAEIFGNGVLAKTEKNTNVVFCQLKPWENNYSDGKHNVKQTFRRSSFLLSRLLGNMGVESTTPLLARFNSPVGSQKEEKRWLEGLYLDQPEEWDDPYRFFRW